MANIEQRRSPGVIVGGRGCGKTHIIIFHSREKPMRIIEFDKRKIDNGEIAFTVLVDNKKPEMIVVDDVHYLIEEMKASRLCGGKLTEKMVIEFLEGFKSEAERIGAKIVFVMAEGPAMTAMRFENDEMRKRFALLLDGCIGDAYDEEFFKEHLNKTYDENELGGYLNLDYRGMTDDYLKIFFDEKTPDLTAWCVRKEFMPLVLAQWPDLIISKAKELWDERRIERLLLQNPLTEEQEGSDTQPVATMGKEAMIKVLTAFFANSGGKRYDDDYRLFDLSLRNYAATLLLSLINETRDRIARAFKVTDIPLFYFDGGLSVQRFPLRDDGYIDYSSREKVLFAAPVDDPEKRRKIVEMTMARSRAVPIATIRELAIVSDALGGISRAALSGAGLRVGIERDKCNVTYSANPGGQPLYLKFGRREAEKREKAQELFDDLLTEKNLDMDDISLTIQNFRIKNPRFKGYDEIFTDELGSIRSAIQEINTDITGRGVAQRGSLASTPEEFVAALIRAEHNLER